MTRVCQKNLVYFQEMKLKHFWHEFPQAFHETGRKRRGTAQLVIKLTVWNCTEFCSFLSSISCIFLVGQRTPLYERTGLKSWKHFNLRLGTHMMTQIQEQIPQQSNPPQRKPYLFNHSIPHEATKTHQLRAGWNTTMSPQHHWKPEYKSSNAKMQLCNWQLAREEHKHLLTTSLKQDLQHNNRCETLISTI